MRKNLTLCLLLSSIVSVGLFTGCAKTITDPFNATNTVPCQVQKIIIPSSLLVASNAITRRPYIARNIPVKMQHVANVAPGASDTLIFTYNAAGNPVSVKHSMDIGDNLLFKYDAQGRLSQYVNIFPNNFGGDYWHKYTYAPGSTNRIIADTAFRDFVSSNGQMTAYNDIDLTVFVYDGEGRVSRSTEYVLGDTIVRHFVYDGTGNLQGNGSVYDSKLNLHRTNKIWMFIDRDYSVNNPVDKGSDTYNSEDLPITIATNDASVTAGFQFTGVGYPFAIKNANINYSCQ